MIKWRETTKIFALIFLLFANFSSFQAQSSIYRLEPGTRIRVQMDNEINSEVSDVNDTFTVTLAEPFKVRESIVIPAGTVIEGRVTKVEAASLGGKDGEMTVKFETIRFSNGEKREIEAVLANQLKTSRSSKAAILTVIGGTALGALIGAVSKSSNGALIGAGIGAGAGTAVAFARKGKDVRIKADEKFEIELAREVTLPVLDY